MFYKCEGEITSTKPWQAVAARQMAYCAWRLDYLHLNGKPCSGQLYLKSTLPPPTVPPSVPAPAGAATPSHPVPVIAVSCFPPVNRSLLLKIMNQIKWLPCLDLPVAATILIKKKKVHGFSPYCLLLMLLDVPFWHHGPHWFLCVFVVFIFSLMKGHSLCGRLFLHPLSSCSGCGPHVFSLRGSLAISLSLHSDSP